MNYRFTRCFYGVVKKVHRTKNKIEKYNKFDFETFYKDFFGLKEKNNKIWVLSLSESFWSLFCGSTPALDFLLQNLKLPKNKNFFFFFFNFLQILSLNFF